MAVALLAPVPEEHLLSGQSVCLNQGKVAFGSKNWELFYKLQGLVQPHGQCEVLIYVSDAGQPISPPTVTWRATYLGFVQSKGGAHPEGMKYRPPSTAKYVLDNQGSWAVFWEVADLTPLSKDQWIKIGQLRGFEKPAKYLTNYIPKGPSLVQEPAVLSGATGLSVLPV
jgi:hypothetical protein